MIANINYFEELMKNNNYNYKSLSKEINIKPSTLSSKIKGDSELKFSEAIDIANVLKMDKQQCLNCFFNLHEA